MRKNEPWKKIKNHAIKTSYFPHSRYATDVTFQHSYCPSKNMGEDKKNVSDRQKLYAHKVEICVLPLNMGAAPDELHTV